MKNIVIGNQKLAIKNYYCSQGEDYPVRQDSKLWLYVNMTDVCNGSCEFCINPCVKNGTKTIDLNSFNETLLMIRDNIYGVSVTGGEPMLFPEIANEIIKSVHRICNQGTEIDLVTNGTGFSTICDTLNMELLDSVHLSRHMISDKDNNEVFGFKTANTSVIKKIVAELKDPAQIVLNCILMKSGIESEEDLASYLEYASSIGIRNVSFIGLSKHNSFCETHYVDPGKLILSRNPRFHIWNTYHDHGFCRCSSGSFDASNGSVRFYYRSIGSQNAPYARQLVYTADNRLLAGFSGKEIRFD